MLKSFLTTTVFVCATSIPAIALDSTAFKPYLSKTCSTYEGNLEVRLQGDLSKPAMVVAFSSKSKFRDTAPIALPTKLTKWGKGICWEAKLRKTNKFYNGSTVSLCQNPDGKIWAGGRPSSQLRKIGWGKETYNNC